MMILHTRICFKRPTIACNSSHLLTIFFILFLILFISLQPVFDFLSPFPRYSNITIRLLHKLHSKNFKIFTLVSDLHDLVLQWAYSLLLLGKEMLDVHDQIRNQHSASQVVVFQQNLTSLF